MHLATLRAFPDANLNMGLTTSSEMEIKKAA